ncbi:pyridoxamine 5'-phosphate oxidase family protein [Saccharomonospora piscinae]|uniref:pyridoxamine 5'-phosphate oxidase family protein n=1 Tax=Saccharomonospora piscinae TaxID=687388 RepID=UPI0004667EAF|nr:pyridoxamine 5'-phosphate oxidase family protein [Saccharomonospora piscinae]
MSTSQAPALSPTPRSTPTRKPHRYATDRDALHKVLDAALVCHLGLIVDGAPVVLPTAYGRDGGTLYLHGSTGSGNVRAAAEGTDVCVTVSVLDGVVYARSLNNHSMNFRCAVVHGRTRAVTGDDERWHALRVISEHLSPGSWDYARTPSPKELAGTLVYAVDLDEASVKIRAGAPGEDEADLDAHDVWAGVLPVHTTFGEPVTADYVPEGVAVPAHVADRVTDRTVRPPS